LIHMAEFWLDLPLDEILNRVVMGLPTGHRISLMLSRPTSLQELLANLKLVSDHSYTPPTTKVFTCSKCGPNKGHNSDRCFKLHPEIKWGSNKNQGQVNAAYTPAPKLTSTIECRWCREQGHPIDSCPDFMHCGGCGKFGHPMLKCWLNPVGPKFKKNLAEKSQVKFDPNGKDVFAQDKLLFSQITKN
jgi:hypothetical protein